MMVKGFKRLKMRPAIFLGFSTCIILLSGCLTLLWHAQQHQITHADGGNIIGPPTLTAATVDAIFKRAGSPMAGTGKVVEQAARQANVDDAFALGVWWAETNDGMAGVGSNDRNPGAVRASPEYPAGIGGYTLYPSYSAAITDWFKILKSRYVARGLTSVYTICYPYVGTAGSASWAAKVVTYMYRYRGETPPMPTVAPPHQIPSHLPFSMTTNGKRKTVDFTQEEKKSALSVPPANGQSTQVQQSGTLVRPTTNQLPLVAFGLLAACVLAFYAHKIRRVTIAFEPATGALITSVPEPLYINQYSPVLAPAFANEYSPVVERNTTTLLPPHWSQPTIERNTTTLLPPHWSQPVVEPVSSQSPFEVQQQFFTLPTDVPSYLLPATPLPAINEAFASYHQNAEVHPYPIRLRHVEEAATVAAETFASNDQIFYATTLQAGTTIDDAYLPTSTEALQHLHTIGSLPDHDPSAPAASIAPVAPATPVYRAPRAGGLLHRYRLEQVDQTIQETASRTC